MSNQTADSIKEMNGLKTFFRSWGFRQGKLKMKRLAEKVGFEPTEPRGSDALQAPAFDHSATSPLNGKYYIIGCQVCQTLKNFFHKR